MYLNLDLRFHIFYCLFVKFFYAPFRFFDLLFYYLFSFFDLIFIALCFPLLFTLVLPLFFG
jgi:hypothetical protein